MKPLFLLISGPSGAGKTTLATRFLETYPSVQRIVTTTTRRPRPDEIPGKDYYFFSEESYNKELERGNFLEHAKVYGHNYGILKSELLDKAKPGCDLLLTIDIQGAQVLMQAFGQLDIPHHFVTVFVSPTSVDVLKNRLKKRATENEDKFQMRLRLAADEMRLSHLFGHSIESRTREEDWVALKSIYDKSKI